MRTKYSIINMMVSFSTQILLLLIKFLGRIIFVKVLGQEYYGLSGLFSNILSMLSLAELGIGSAITFSLYLPLANKDNKNIAALMSFYKKTYNIIGITILIVGFLLTPFLHIFIKEMPNIPSIKLIYNLFVINSGISYFFSYNSSLLIADQKQYIYSINRVIFNILLCIFQIFSLFLTHSYIIFLVIQILFTLFENSVMYFWVRKTYPYLRTLKKEKVTKSDLNIIKKNTSSLILQKISGIIVTSTDNILLSKFIGLAVVGIYSNYSLIISSLDSLLYQVIKSITASIGNLATEHNQTKMRKVYNKVFLIFFWIFCFVFIELYLNINILIEIMFGKSFLFSNFITFILCFRFFLEGLRRPNNVYIEALGLFWSQRYKAIFEMLLNLFFSIILIIKFEVIGIFLGTILSSIFTNYWFEPYILFKKGFEYPVKSYFVKYFKYIIITLILLLICSIVCQLMSFDSLILQLIYNIFTIFFIVNTFLFLFFRKDENFIFFIDKIKKSTFFLKLWN